MIQIVDMQHNLKAFKHSYRPHPPPPPKKNNHFRYNKEYSILQKIMLFADILSRFRFN